MNLYKLQGTLKKEKREDIIYVLAENQEQAFEKVASFAAEVSYISHEPTPAWNAFAG